MASVERVGPERAAEVYELRLRALREDPDAYLTAYEEELARGVELVEQRMREGAPDPAYGVFVASHEGALVGMLGTVRIGRARVQHKALIWGVWVAPEARRLGIGRLLLDAAIDHLRRAGDIELVHLAVSTNREPARRLYLDAGFEVWGVEAHAMKIGDAYVDEEHMVLHL